MPAEGDRELILYATPTGPLAAACDEYFAAASELGPTVAQTYPPHCTLTGFFHRSPAEAEATIAALARLLADTGPVPDGAVEVGGLTTSEGWVGLELRSEWLAKLIAAAVAEHDDLRPKDWLHLSLAYGVDDLAEHAALAERLVDPAAPAGWETAVWERIGGTTWVRHG